MGLLSRLVTPASTNGGQHGGALVYFLCDACARAVRHKHPDGQTDTHSTIRLAFVLMYLACHFLCGRHTQTHRHTHKPYNRCLPRTAWRYHSGTHVTSSFVFLYTCTPDLAVLSSST